MNDEWLKQNYEKVVLIVATVIAVGLSGWLILQGLAFGENFERAAVAPSDRMPETGIEKLEVASKALNEAVLWEGENLFVSAPVLEVDGALQEVGTGKVHDPIEDTWVFKHDLRIRDSDLKDQDPDNDRFTNLEEYLNKTDPTDAASHPPFIAKLCLESMVDSDLHLVFRTQVDPKTWQIDLVSPDGKYRGRNMLVTKTERFGPDDMFRLDGFQEKVGVDERGVPIDESEVIISYVEAGGNQRVNQSLVRNEPWVMPTHEGTFLYRFDNSNIPGKRGSSFKLPNEPDSVFTVVEVDAQGATLKDQNGKEYTIPPCE